MKNFGTLFIAFCAVIGIIVIAMMINLLLAFPFMWLWNYAVVSAISVAQPIEYWVSFWLMLFIVLFITGFNTSSKK